MMHFSSGFVADDHKYHRDCVVPYVRHFLTGYGIFHCDSMKYDLMLHNIELELNMPFPV